jgi:hypothetical protein
VKGAGTLAARALPRVAGVVSWAGLISIGPELINQGLTYFYNQAKLQSGNADLDALFAGNTSGAVHPFQKPMGVNYYDDSIRYTVRYDGLSYRCEAYGHSFYDGVRTLVDINQVEMVVVSDDASISVTGTKTTLPDFGYCSKAKTLEEIIDNPGVAAAVSTAVGRFINDKPEVIVPLLKYQPEPTPNQRAGEILGAGDSNGDGIDDRAAAAVGKDAGDPDKVVTSADLHSSSTINESGGAITVTRRDISPIDGHVTTSSRTFTPGTTPEVVTNNANGSVTRTTTLTTPNGSVTRTAVTTTVTSADNPVTGGKTETTTETTDTTTTSPEGDEAKTTETKETKREIPKAEPKPCQSGDPACTPKPDECPTGQVKGSDGICKAPDPGDACNDFSLARFASHPATYIKDLFIPCDGMSDVFNRLASAVHDRFPFSLTSKLNQLVTASGSPEQSAVLPSRLGPFDLDWAWIVPLLFTVGLLFKAAIAFIAIDVLLGKMTGQLVIK